MFKLLARVEKEPEWLANKTKEQKKAYFDKYPGSKYNPNRKKKKEIDEPKVKKTKKKVLPKIRKIKNIERIKNFRKWAGKGTKVIHSIHDPLITFDSKQPVVVKVLHGTLYDFKEFSPSKLYENSNVGKGFYFTNSTTDASINYATPEGPDHKIKKDGEIDSIIHSIDLDDFDINAGELPKYLTIEDLTEDQLSGKDTTLNWEQATKIFNLSKKQEGHQGALMPVYVKFNKPAIIGHDSKQIDDFYGVENKSTVLRMESNPYPEDSEELDDWDIFEESEGEAIDLLNILNENYTHSIYDSFKLEIVQRIMDYGEINIRELYSIANNTLDIYTDDNDNDVSPAGIVAELLRELGYDGVIDQTVKSKFRDMQGMDDLTKHFITFNPKNIKSAIGNYTFNPDSDDITAKLIGER